MENTDDDDKKKKKEHAHSHTDNIKLVTALLALEKRMKSAWRRKQAEVVSSRSSPSTPEFLVDARPPPSKRINWK